MPELVLCICTCGRPAGLERVLGAVDGLEWPEGEMPSFAVVVVDNLPDGRARAVVERLRPAFRWPLHFVEEPERGISQARNRAVAEALSLGAEFVAFVDDDDVPRPDWLWWLWQRQRETGADIVFGDFVFEVSPSASLLTRVYANHLNKKKPLIARNQKCRNRLPARTGTANVLIGRRILQCLKRRDKYVFATDLSFSGGEDAHMFYRAVAAGARCVTCDESIVEYSMPSHFGSMLRRQFRYGYSSIQAACAIGGRSDCVCTTLFRIFKNVIRIAAWPSPEHVAVSSAKIAYQLGQLRACLSGQLRDYERAFGNIVT